MKHINLATRPSFFPLTKDKQIKFSLFIFVIFIAYFTMKITYLNFNERETLKEIAILRDEIKKIKEMVSEREQIINIKNEIEREFSINIDKNLIVANSFVSELLKTLSEVTPENLWITSLDMKYSDERFIRISGKSKTKIDIFNFMENLKGKYKDVNLINMQYAENGIFIFNLRLEIL